jgi:hypothetical protein
MIEENKNLVILLRRGEREREREIEIEIGSMELLPRYH